MRQPDDVHEWVSFEDTTEHRTWVFDATFLLSAWTCIWGRGCQGVHEVPTPEKQQGCCSHGAHLADDDDVARVGQHVARLTPAQWQFHGTGRRRGWMETDREGSTLTRRVQGACVFLNRPGFAGGAGCALHGAALAAGERPLDWKPTVCWQLPLRRDDHTDDHGHVTTTVREWKRRDWGGGGEAFAWWCTDAPDAFVGAVPAYRGLREELTELVGAEVYAILAELLDARPRRTVLPHPAVRRR